MTTGVPAGTVLTPESGNLEITDDNVVVNGVDLSGSFDVYGNNVVIENSRITTTTWWGINQRQTATGLKVLNCTIVGVPGLGVDSGGEDYGVSNMGNGAIEIARSDISEFQAGISIGNGDVHDNYVHDMQTFSVNGAIVHTDPFISSGGDPAGLSIVHNTLLNQLGPLQGASAAIGLFADSGIVSNSTVDNNWIAGGAYALYGGNVGSTNVKITNNRFSTIYWPFAGIYGAVAYSFPNDPGNVWSGNIWADGPNAGQMVTP